MTQGGHDEASPRNIRGSIQSMGRGQKTGVAHFANRWGDMASERIALENCKSRLIGGPIPVNSGLFALAQPSRPSGVVRLGCPGRSAPSWLRSCQPLASHEECNDEADPGSSRPGPGADVSRPGADAARHHTRAACGERGAPAAATSSASWRTAFAWRERGP